MSDSLQLPATVTVDIPLDVLAKVEKVAEEKKLSIEDTLLYLIRVASHR